MIQASCKSQKAKKLPVFREGGKRKFCVLLRVLDNKGKDVTLGGYFVENKEELLKILQEASDIVKLM